MITAAARVVRLDPCCSTAEGGFTIALWQVIEKHRAQARSYTPAEILRRSCRSALARELWIPVGAGSSRELLLLLSL